MSKKCDSWACLNLIIVSNLQLFGCFKILNHIINSCRKLMFWIALFLHVYELKKKKIVM